MAHKRRGSGSFLRPATTTSRDAGACPSSIAGLARPEQLSWIRRRRWRRRGSRSSGGWATARWSRATERTAERDGDKPPPVHLLLPGDLARVWPLPRGREVVDWLVVGPGYRSSDQPTRWRVPVVAVGILGAAAGLSPGQRDPRLDRLANLCVRAGGRARQPSAAPRARTMPSGVRSCPTPPDARRSWDRVGPDLPCTMTRRRPGGHAMKVPISSANSQEGTK